MAIFPFAVLFRSDPTQLGYYEATALVTDLRTHPMVDAGNVREWDLLQLIQLNTNFEFTVNLDRVDRNVRRDHEYQSSSVVRSSLAGVWDHRLHCFWRIRGQHESGDWAYRGHLTKFDMTLTILKAAVRINEVLGVSSRALSPAPPKRR